MSRVLAESMAGRLQSASVITCAAGAPVVPDIRVALEMRRFEAIPGQEVIVEAHWWARAGTQQTASEGTGVARLPVRGRPDDYESLVAAEAAALAAIGADVAGVIQRETAD